ncbi:hypothetical protein [Nocardia pseudobrasiliensis]|uniref:Uncharacterized protein n=1 Tax=Nocardia pseudobrasiliensis TaxID=45979 RepID=A0A370IF66_9NOCA|nr:hypothetical protein [Nocardia pseudobrasiliensis]RDI68791.1 hypothetical protein DFR76_101326 [Nocardia pseudobrasiliensis]
MSPGPNGRPALRIPEVERWRPDVLGTDATQFDKVVTEGDRLLRSMLTEQDALARSWKGAGADSATARITAEKTAGSHLMARIGNLETALTTYRDQLTHARQFVLDRRNLIVDMGFEVADDGTVTSVAKQQALRAAAGRNPKCDPGYLAKALLDVEYEAAQQQLAMVTALQNADNTATATKAAIDLAKSELARVALYELPPTPRTNILMRQASPPRPPPVRNGPTRAADRWSDRRGREWRSPTASSSRPCGCSIPASRVRGTLSPAQWIPPPTRPPRQKSDRH